MTTVKKNLDLDEGYDKDFFLEIERGIEQGLYAPERSDKKMTEWIKKAAHNTLAKNATVNFRVNKYTLARFKARAAEQGVPYQTLLSSLMHTYVK
jgi:predicted DNA binding CopG/RHH family protein